MAVERGRDAAARGLAAGARGRAATAARGPAAVVTVTEAEVEARAEAAMDPEAVEGAGEKARVAAVRATAAAIHRRKAHTRVRYWPDKVAHVSSKQVRKSK